VLLKTTKSAQAGLFAPPNSISSRSHNFPNIAPIDVLFDSDCSLGPADQTRVFGMVDILPNPSSHQHTWQPSKKFRKKPKIATSSTDQRPATPSINAINQPDAWPSGYGASFR
jgi:hypothetical protein